MHDIQRMLSRFPIAQRLWVGFSIVLGILALAVATAWLSLNATRGKVDTVINDLQPAVLASTALMNELKEASTSLGFYLLTQEVLHKDAYDQHLKNIDARETELKQALERIDDDESRRALESVESAIVRFKNYQPQMIEIAEQQGKNFIALGYAGEHINPVSQDMLQVLSEMILSESEEEASSKRKKLLMTIEDLRYTWSNIMNNLRVYVLFGNKDLLSNIRLFYEGAGKNIKQIKENASILTFEQEEGMSRVEDYYKKFGIEFNKLVEIHAGDRARMDAYLVRTEIGPLLRDIDTQLLHLVESQRERIAKTSDALNSQITQATGLMLLLLAAGLGIGFAVSWAITRMIAAPLKDAAGAMQDIARGEGDLTRRLQQSGSDEIGKVSEAFNQFAGKIQDLVREVSRATEELAAATRGVEKATSRTASALQHQKTSTQEMAISVQHMSTSAEHVATSAEQTAAAAQSADEETVSGKHTVDEALKAINTLTEDTQTTANVIERLGKEIQSISTVVDVISGIADQTNLLALNAAIEAARAGEQGRGFAVVADEVRTLATRTRESTQQIQSKVAGLQQDAKNAVQHIVNNRNVARSTSALAARAGTSLNSITQSVTGITQMMSQIAGAAEEQYRVVDTIRGNIENIGQMAEETDGAVNDVTALVADLSRLSVTLNGLVGRFKI